MSRTTERVGRSGEYFVASLLSQISDTVLMVPHSAEADLLFEYNNTLYKVQVKTKTKIEKHRTNWLCLCLPTTHECSISQSRRYQ
jgi:hypothetical protein